MHISIIIYMTKESSHQLLHAQFMQSDIAFKRVAGFLEFEVGGLNQNAKIGFFFSCGVGRIPDFAGLTYCYVYVNHKFTMAHHLIFQNLKTIIQQDTSKSLQWRYLHTKSLNDFTGILQWMGDQHRDQAK